MKVITRKTHKKSRNGCFSCKSRRIKCDEDRPQCQNCVKKNLDCSYPEVKFIMGLTKTRSLPHIDTKTSDSSTSVNNSQINTPTNSISPLGMVKDKSLSTIDEYLASEEVVAELITFSFNELYLKLSTNEDEREVWLVNIRELFFANKGLYHMIMSLSALYMYHSNPVLNHRYYLISQHHYTKCLAIFSDSLIPKNQQESTSNMFITLLLPLYFIASPDYRCSEISLFKVGHGIKAMFEQVKYELPSAFRGGLTLKYSNKSYDQLVGMGYPEYWNEILEIQPWESTIEAEESSSGEINLATNTAVKEGRLTYHDIYRKYLNVIYNQYCYINDATSPDEAFMPVLIRMVMGISDEVLELIDRKDSRMTVLLLAGVRVYLELESTWYKHACIQEIRLLQKELNEGWTDWLQGHDAYIYD